MLIDKNPSEIIIDIVSILTEKMALSFNDQDTIRGVFTNYFLDNNLTIIKK